eukprot:5671837-Alexandrium_andersonii.AAC.1
MAASCVANCVVVVVVIVAVVEVIVPVQGGTRSGRFGSRRVRFRRSMRFDRYPCAGQPGPSV